MKKLRILPLVLALLALPALTGCHAGEQLDALAAGEWYRTEYLPETTAETFLAALDLAAEEIAAADLTAMAVVRRVEFTPEKTYRFFCDAEATRALAEEYLDALFTALADDPGMPPAEYAGSRTAEEIAAMTPEQRRALYAELFGCSDYAALLQRMTDGLMDYAALAEWGETGRFSLRGDRLLLTDADGGDRGSVGFLLDETGLTLRYANGAEQYENRA